MNFFQSVDYEAIPSTSTAFQNAISLISPVTDDLQRKIISRKRKGEKSEILTSTPYKKMLEDKAEVKQQVELKKQEKAKQQSITKQSRRNNEKHKINIKSEKFLSVKRKLIDEAEEKKTDEKASNKTECIICGETFEEDWVQCSRCDGWAHVECADNDNILYFVCDHCIQ